MDYLRLTTKVNIKAKQMKVWDAKLKGLSQMKEIVIMIRQPVATRYSVAFFDKKADDNY